MVPGKGRENGYRAGLEVADGHTIEEFLRRQPMELVNTFLTIDQAAASISAITMGPKPTSTPCKAGMAC